MTEEKRGIHMEIIQEAGKQVRKDRNTKGVNGNVVNERKRGKERIKSKLCR